MKVKIKRKFVLIYIAVFIIVLSESLFFMHRNLGHILEYVGYLMLLGQILISFYHVENNYQKKIFFFFCCYCYSYEFRFLGIRFGFDKKNSIVLYCIRNIYFGSPVQKLYYFFRFAEVNFILCVFFNIDSCNVSHYRWR
ncbi:MAG TPA: hypothetical protein DEB74_19935 [Lachnospiraceae bacterium]|nr:hypothetical protein [Lachnospiraceae bacterium]